MKRWLGEVDNIFFIFGLIALAATMASVLLYVCTGFNVLNIKYPCFFYYITGIYCPGCGGTRAVKALLRGDIWQSFIDYPPIIYGIVVYLVFMVRCFYIIISGLFGRENAKDGVIIPYIYVGLVLVLIQWIVKVVALVAFDCTWIR